MMSCRGLVEELIQGKVDGDSGSTLFIRVGTSLYILRGRKS